MESGKRWSSVKRKPKSFIRRCLVVDENQRMTAKEALLHPWLADKSYAPLLESVYQRAIEDWKPRGKSLDLVQIIDTTDVVSDSCRPEHVKRLAEEVRSRHFSDMPLAPSLRSMLGPLRTHRTPHKRKRTSLPTISDLVDEDRPEAPASPSLTQLHNFFVNPLHASELTQSEVMTANESMVGLSIEDFAPPKTHLLA